MMYLAIDTTATYCSIAVGHDEIFYSNSVNGIEKRDNIFQWLNTIASCDLLKQVSLIALCVGPGSYTGIRLGRSIALALSFACNIPLKEVTVFDIIRFVYAEQYENIIVPCVQDKFYMQNMDIVDVCDIDFSSKLLSDRFSINNTIQVNWTAIDMIKFLLEDSLIA